MRRGIIGGWPVRAEFVEQTAVSDETAVTVEERRLAGPPPGPPVDPPPDRELWPWLLVLLVLVLAGIAVVYFATRDDTSTHGQASTQAAVQPKTAPPVRRRLLFALRHRRDDCRAATGGFQRQRH